MKLHERYMLVQGAGIELTQFIIDWENRHNLTFGETIKLLSIQIETQAKYLIRAERHPDDPDKKGDEA